eukprot:Polyplicarium_translucidae@DN493_c0_g1_i1.p1
MDESREIFRRGFHRWARPTLWARWGQMEPTVRSSESGELTPYVDCGTESSTDSPLRSNPEPVASGASDGSSDVSATEEEDEEDEEDEASLSQLFQDYQQKKAAPGCPDETPELEHLWLAFVDEAESLLYHQLKSDFWMQIFYFARHLWPLFVEPVAAGSVRAAEETLGRLKQGIHPHSNEINRHWGSQFLPALLPSHSQLTSCHAESDPPRQLQSGRNTSSVRYFDVHIQPQGWSCRSSASCCCLLVTFALGRIEPPIDSSSRPSGSTVMRKADQTATTGSASAREGTRQRLRNWKLPEVGRSLCTDCSSYSTSSPC